MWQPLTPLRYGPMPHFDFLLKNVTTPSPVPRNDGQIPVQILPPPVVAPPYPTAAFLACRKDTCYLLFFGCGKRAVGVFILTTSRPAVLALYPSLRPPPPTLTIKEGPCLVWISTSWSCWFSSLQPSKGYRQRHFPRSYLCECCRAVKTTKIPLQAAPCHRISKNA